MAAEVTQWRVEERKVEYATSIQETANTLQAIRADIDKTLRRLAMALVEVLELDDPQDES